MKNIYNNNQVYTKNSSTSEILRNRTVFIFYNNTDHKIDEIKGCNKTITNMTIPTIKYKSLLSESNSEHAVNFAVIVLAIKYPIIAPVVFVIISLMSVVL